MIPALLVVAAAIFCLASAIIYHARKGQHLMSAIQRLASSVAAMTTVAASATHLLTNIAGQIRENAGDEDAMNRLADELDADTASLTDAITANTPAAERTAGDAAHDPDVQVPGAETETDQVDQQQDDSAGLETGNQGERAAASDGTELDTSGQDEQHD